MCTQACIDLCCKDFLLLFLTFILSGFWPFILYLLKPNIKIVSFSKDNNKYKLKVQNNAHSNAVNLKIEICSINLDSTNNITKHFDLESDDFLILPKKGNKTSDNFRYFALTANSTTELSKKLQNDSTLKLRVRLYACHAYSGFGKAFECFFVYKDGEFELQR